MKLWAGEGFGWNEDRCPATSLYVRQIESEARDLRGCYIGTLAPAAGDVPPCMALSYRFCT